MSDTAAAALPMTRVDLPDRRLKSRPPDPTPNLDDEIGRLETLDLSALRVQYRNRTGRIAPARVSRTLLMRVVAYRIQADTHGDLDRTTRRLLERLGVMGEGDPDVEGEGCSAVLAIETTASLKPGTVLKREWQGRMEHVMVMADGYAWNGTSYPSLSATAFAITGTKWNGYRFFGVPSPGAEASKRSKAGSTSPSASESSMDHSRSRAVSAGREVVSDPLLGATS